MTEEQINKDELVELLALRSAGKRTAEVFNLVSTIRLYWYLKRYSKRNVLLCNQAKFQAHNMEIHRKHIKMRDF